MDLNSDISDDGFDDAVVGLCTFIDFLISQRELTEFENYKLSVFFPGMNSTNVLCNYER